MNICRWPSTYRLTNSVAVKEKSLFFFVGFDFVVFSCDCVFCFVYCRPVLVRPGGVVVVTLEAITAVGPCFESRRQGDFFLGTTRASQLTAVHVETIPRGKRLHCVRPIRRQSTRGTDGGTLRAINNVGINRSGMGGIGSTL